VSTAKLASIGRMGVQQRAVDQADMVGRDQHAGAGRRQVFQPAHLGAEQCAENQRAEIAHAFLAPFAQHEPDRPEACDREPKEDPGDGKASGLQQRDDQRATDHEARLQNIARGDDACALGRRGPGLYGGKGRHHEEAAAKGEQEKSRSMCTPANEVAKAAAVTSVPCAACPIAQARSSPMIPITMAPIGTSARFGRTWLSWAANSEPAAMPMANTARHSVTTPSVPPTLSLISAGSSDSTMAPTIQNHDTISMPSHSRGSA